MVVVVSSNRRDFRNERAEKNRREDVCLFVTRKKGGALHTKRLALFLTVVASILVVSLVLLILRAMMVLQIVRKRNDYTRTIRVVRYWSGAR